MFDEIKEYLEIQWYNTDEMLKIQYETRIASNHWKRYLEALDWLEEARMILDFMDTDIDELDIPSVIQFYMEVEEFEAIIHHINLLVGTV